MCAALSRQPGPSPAATEDVMPNAPRTQSAAARPRSERMFIAKSSSSMGAADRMVGAVEFHVNADRGIRDNRKASFHSVRGLAVSEISQDACVGDSEDWCRFLLCCC